MKIKTHKYNKQILVTLAIFLALVLLFFSLERAGVTHFLASSKRTQNQKTVTQEDSKKKQDYIENGGSKGQTAPSTTNTNSSSANSATPSPSSKVTIKATQQDAQTVIVSSKLEDFPDGSCALAISNGSSSYAANATIIYQTQFSTCAGFSVPISKLGAGTWTIKLTATTNGTSLYNTASLEVK